MKLEKEVLKFLEDNSVIINSLMSDNERSIFHGDIVSIIIKEIKKQIA